MIVSRERYVKYPNKSELFAVNKADYKIRRVMLTCKSVRISKHKS